jgi:hypothetical protein
MSAADLGWKWRKWHLNLQPWAYVRAEDKCWKPGSKVAKVVVEFATLRAKFAMEKTLEAWAKGGEGGG